MKFLANLLVVISLLLGQFNTPSFSPAVPVVRTPTPTQTATATMTPTVEAPATGPAIPTDTAAPTETPASFITETSTPAPTDIDSTPTPTETLPPAEPQIAVTLSSTPSFVTPGGHINIDWAIEGILPEEHELFLLVTLPQGFTPTDKDSKYDETTLTLSIPVTKANGQFGLQAEQPAEDAVLTVSLIEKENVLTETSLVLATKDQFALTSKGGSIQTEDGRIKLNIPANTFSEDAIIQIGEPSGDEVPAYSLSGHPFSIKAQSKAARSSLHQFNTKIEIEASYADLNIPAERTSDLYIYWHNPDTGDWEALSSYVDPEAKKIYSVTDHFSVFDIGINDWQATHLPTVDAFQVSQFTGAGSLSLPIDLPAGPGGLKPSLTLSYNSQVIDQARIDTQASWVGMGWSLDAPAIERDTHGTTSDTGDDTFMLSVAGVSTRLVYMGSGGYQAQDKNFWRIERNSDADTWTVWDTSGNIYYFGDIAEETVGATAHTLYRTDDGHELIRQTYRWSLRRQQNIFGKSILYTYAKETKVLSVIGVGGLTRTDEADTAVYPEYIIYPNDHYRIWFETEARWDYYEGWKIDAAYHSFQQKRLKSLHIQNYANGAWSTVTRYDFGYVNDTAPDHVFPGVSAQHPNNPTGKVTTLRSFRQVDATGSVGLPPYTFEYADKLHLTKAYNGYGGSVEFDYDSDPNQVLYEPWYYDTNARETYTAEFKFGPSGEMGLCIKVPGNQGGWTALNGTVSCTTGGYLSVQGTGYNPTTFVSIRPGGYYKLTMTAGGASPSVGLYNGSTVSAGNGTSAFVLLPATASVAAPAIQSAAGGTVYVSNYKMQLLPTFYRVYRKTISDGTNTYTYNYSYSGPAMNDTLPGADGNPHSLMAQACSVGQVDCNEYIEELSEFRGHAQVTETGPDGRKVVTKYHQDDARKGRPISVENLNSTGNLLSSTLYEYGVTSADVGFWSYYHIMGLKQYWVFTGTQENRTYGYNNTGSPYSATKSFFTYDANYGNQISVVEKFWNGSGWEPFRTTGTNYLPNISSNRYLVSLPESQNVIDKDGNLIAQTLYVYDDKTTLNSTPDDGILTAVLKWVTGSNYSSTSFSYDSWGNQTSVTTYSGYGTPWQATGARTTYTCYGSGEPVGGNACADDGYRTYPIWIKNSLGQTTTTSYDYAKGVPLSEMDPNGAETRATYDAFGRIANLYRPDPVSGSAESTPSLSMVYSDVTSVTNMNPVQLVTTITQHVSSSPSDTYFSISRTYDGMGRPISSVSYAGTYQASPSTLPGAVLTKTEYPLINETRQSVPYFYGEDPQYTDTISYPDGHTTKVFATDNTVTTTTTDGLKTTVSDPRGNATTTVKDVWGRVTSVTPPTGTGPGVSYTYDTLGNLLTASRGGVTSTMTYNQAGQKLTMADPDMGNWTYNYDALGNLTSQTNAESQTTCLYYDSLNRLRFKNYQSNSTCPASPSNGGNAVEYTYDSTANGNYGKGRRTGMTDPSGSTTWKYDIRGHLLSENKIISGKTFLTSWTYNLADQPISMTYPGGDSGQPGEVVTFGYDSRMLISSLTGESQTAYVTNTVYDPSGRISLRVYGNNTQTQYNYYPWTQKGGRLQQIVSKRNPNYIFQNLSYIYDASGNVTSITDAMAGPQIQNFAYDNLDRLISANAVGGEAASQYSESYTYNSVTGNLATKTKGQTEYQYNYDPLHAHAVLSFSGGNVSNSYSYDNNGNMTTRTLNNIAANLEYDAEGRLTSVSGLVPTGTGTVIYPTPTAIASTPTSTPLPTSTPTRTPTATATPLPIFSDVPYGNPYKAYIEGIYNAGITTGCASNPLRYCPSNNLNRAEFAVMLLRAEHGPSYTPPAVGSSTGFTDVPVTHWAAAWIKQFAAEGISSGCGGGNFCPDTIVTRDTAAVLILRAKNGNTFTPPTYTTYSYNDISTSSLKNWIQHLASSGVIDNCSAGNYCPTTALTRERVAYFIARVFLSMAYQADPTQVVAAATPPLPASIQGANKVMAVPARQQQGQAVNATFLYDGDGRRVASTINGVTTYFVGNYYEKVVTSNTTKINKYYYAGAQRVAMRTGGTLFYLLGDHLGSTSMTLDASGNVVSELRYTAWGEVRYQAGPTTTTYTYTGQYSYMDDPTTSGTTEGFGLMFYNARWYDPALGRFAQADTIIPGGSQGLDRYAYSNNSPERYTDPSGHRPCGDGEEADCSGKIGIKHIRSGCGTPNTTDCGGGHTNDDLEDFIAYCSSILYSSPACRGYEPPTELPHDIGIDLLYFYHYFAYYINMGIDAAETYESYLKGGWKAAKFSLNLGPVEAIAAGVEQYNRDSWWQKFSFKERANRVLLAAGLAYLADIAADKAGDGAAPFGVAAGGPLGGVGAKMAANTATTKIVYKIYAITVYPWASEHLGGYFP